MQFLVEGIIIHWHVRAAQILFFFRVLKRARLTTYLNLHYLGALQAVKLSEKLESVQKCAMYII